MKVKDTPLIFDKKAYPAKHQAGVARQRGISLFIVLVVLLLTLIIVLGSLRVANLNESVVGNQSDAQRAMAAAEALVAAAQRDIRENGKNCAAATCRFPRDMSEFYTLRSTIGIDQCGNTNSPGNQTKGVCTPASPGANLASGDPVPTAANYPFHVDNVAQRGQPQGIANGATYTEFINAPGGTTSNFATGFAGAGNSRIDLQLDNSSSRYWVEVFPYDVNTGALISTENLPVPDGTYPFIFRITARAVGIKDGTTTTLRTFYVPYPRLPVS